MKALVLRERNAFPVFEPDYPDPVGKEGWSVVGLAYAAINRRDIWISQGMYAGITLPVVLGSDASGYVDHRPVLINPGLDWGDSPEYQSRKFNILGMPLDGTFAQSVRVPDSHIYPIPAHLNMKEAAALPLAGVTAYRALFTRGRLYKGERVLITGIGGGVAHLVMKFAIAAGAEVFVSSSNEKLLAEAVDSGARFGVNYKYNPDWSVSLKERVGAFDLIIDSAGGAPYPTLVKLLDFGGRIVSYGGTLGRIPGLSPQLIFWKQLNLLGSTMGSPTDFEAMLDFVSEYEIVPDIGAVFPLSEGAEAFAFAAKGGHRKVVFEIEEDG